MLRFSILCVDDHDTCSNLSDILSDLGYEVAVAYNTSDALKHLATNGYAVGVFGFDTPEVNGVELWKQMSAGQGTHGCIMVTKNMQSSEFVDADKMLGDRCVLIKPIDVARMLRFIDGVAREFV